jgi:putative membrane protein
MAYAYGFGCGFGFFHFFGTLLFFVFLFFVIKFFLRGGCGWGWRRGYHRWSRVEASDEALRTARERLAKGQLSAEEFARVSAGLRADTAPRDTQPFESWFGHDSALSIARMRYAKGEITAEEFEAIKRALG